MRKSFFFILSLMLAQNCIHWVDYSFPEREKSIPGNFRAKMTLSIDSVKSGIFGPDRSVKPPLYEHGSWRKSYEREVYGSKYIRPVVSQLWDTDLRLSIEHTVGYKINTANLAAYSATLFIVPLRNIMQNQVVFYFKDKDNRLLATYTREYEETYWSQLLLIIALPYYLMFDTDRKITHTVVLSVLEEAYQAGILTSKSAPTEAKGTREFFVSEEAEPSREIR